MISEVYPVCILQFSCFTKYNRMQSKHKQTKCEHSRRNSSRCQLFQWVSLYQIKELFEKTISNSSLNSHVWDTLLFTHIAPTQNTAGAPIRLQRCRAQKLRVCGKNSVPFQATGYLLYKSIKCTKHIGKMLSLFIQKPTSFLNHPISFINI